MKVNITMNDDLMTKVDEYAEMNYTSRSGFISTAVAQYISGLEMQKNFGKIALAFEKIAVSGVVDQEELKELNNLAITCQVLSGRK